MDLTFNDTVKNYNYTWEYTDQFLIPVYEYKVDNVTILKIWKNDLEHTKADWKLFEKLYSGEIRLKKNENIITSEMKEEVILSKVTLYFDAMDSCTLPTNTFVEISSDGENWVRQKDWVPFPQVGGKKNLGSNQLTFLFAGSRARYIRFILDSSNSCLMNNPRSQIYILTKQ